MDNNPENVARAKRAEQFLNSPFYKKDLKPWIDDRINQYQNIKEIGDDIVKTYYKNHGKMEAFQSILNKLKEWTKLKIVDEGGGEKDG